MRHASATASALIALCNDYVNGIQTCMEPEDVVPDPATIPGCITVIAGARSTCVIDVDISLYSILFISCFSSTLELKVLRADSQDVFYPGT